MAITRLITSCEDYYDVNESGCGDYMYGLITSFDDDFLGSEADESSKAGGFIIRS